MTDSTSIELDAKAAYEAIRSINHATIFTGEGIPAPVVYQVLGFLQSAGGYGVQYVLATNSQPIAVASYDLLPVAEKAPLPSEADLERALDNCAPILRNKSLRDSGGSSTSSLNQDLFESPHSAESWKRHERAPAFGATGASGSPGR